jgi:DNA-binding LytR/AlgR family response regulator
MKCIIIDDEPLAREGLLTQLRTIPDISVIGSFNSAKKASAFMQENLVNLIFLDIQMPDINGLEFAASLPKETLVVFTTAYSKYALDSYQVEAIDYLVKPIIKQQLERAVSKAQIYNGLFSRSGTTESIAIDYILVKAERRYHKILFENIFYIEGLKDYVLIHTRENRIITAMNLKTIQKHLDINSFARVSKSYLVNISHIDSFDKNTIYIRQAEIPIGDLFKKPFLKLYLGKDIPEL